jgi:hypothetical protein
VDRQGSLVLDNFVLDSIRPVRCGLDFGDDYFQMGTIVSGRWAFRGIENEVWAALLFVAAFGLVHEQRPLDFLWPARNFGVDHDLSKGQGSEG